MDGEVKTQGERLRLLRELAMSKIGGYTSFDVGFQKNIYEKANAATTRNKRSGSESVGMAEYIHSVT